MIRPFPVTLALCLPSIAGAATTFTFSQSGFDNGGVFSGSLIIDVDERLTLDSPLSNSSIGVIDANATVVGNAVVPDLSFDLSDLAGLKVDLATGEVFRLQFSDDLSVVPPFFAQYFPSTSITTQIGRTTIDGPGTGGSADNQLSSETLTLTAVTTPPPVVPLPAAAWLLAAALAGLGAVARRR